jgi:hypothetical protein
MDSEQTPINARPKRRRHLPSAAENAALAFEERVIWRGEDALRSAGGGLRHGLDRVLWTLQRRLLWPAQDRVRDLDGPGRAVTMAAVVLLAAAAGVAGLLWAASGGSGGAGTTRVAEVQVTQAPAPTPAPAKEKAAPILHGAAPVFRPAQGSDARVSSAKGVGKSSSGSAEAGSEAAAPASSSAATGTISSSPSASTSSAQTAALSGPPAGPAAIATAREFADAFVVYETGGVEARVRHAFTATATHQLARSLLRRPPKQPATVKVPEAKVVNVVAAPSHGPVYPVSVSLLRVGVTSELRLEMEKAKQDGWQVVNVLG